MNRISPQILTALFLILLAAALFVLSQAGFLQPLEDNLLRPLAGVQSWISTRFFALRDFITSPRDVASLQERIAELESQVSQLQQQVITLQEQAAEAEVLSALLQYARSQPQSRYIAANVIGRDPSPFLRSIIISAGSDDGIVHGMPVVTDSGLVGRVNEVFANISRVQLISDPELSVNVRLQESRADGVLSAQVNGELWVEMIDQDAVVEEEELILTSGLGGGYPENIVVGRVVNVRKRDFELFQRAVIQPSVDFDELEIVLVITNFQQLPVELPEASP